MNSYRRAVEDEAIKLKDSYLALERLHRLYQKFDATEREMADQVLTEWVLSDDEGTRFEAMSLIDDFKIERTIPALKELAGRLASSKAPGAPYEIMKIEGLLSEFSSGERPSTS
ncbi:MAG TPA: hypothetical protein VJQ55_01360 [Candidatus Binatia bacterium]|nr:hypothetical protein [Candidatus Binatia bacterium]